MTEHPHITQTPGVCGGRLVVRGTRIPVKVRVDWTSGQEETTVWAARIRARPGARTRMFRFYASEDIERSDLLRQLFQKIGEG